MTQQPKPAQRIQSANRQEESRAIDKPPDKELPAPVGDRDGRKFVYIDDASEPQKPSKSAPSNASLARALTGLPVAVAEPLGSICTGLRIYHPSGAIEHRGLFSSAENAATAARELNRHFLQEGGGQ